MSVKWEKPRPASHLSRCYAVSYNDNTICYPAIEQGWTYFLQFSSRSLIQKCTLVNYIVRGQDFLLLLHTFFPHVRISVLFRKDTFLLNDFTRYESTNKNCNGRNLICWIRLEAKEISVLNVQEYEKNSVEFKNWSMGFRTRRLNLSIVNNNASTLQLYKTS